MATLNLKNFPDALYEHLRARARRERRSIAQEVIHLLAQAVEPAAARSIMELQGLGKEYDPETLAAELRAIAKRAAAHVKRPYLDHAELLYDEHGLPK